MVNRPGLREWLVNLNLVSPRGNRHLRLTIVEHEVWLPGIKHRALMHHRKESIISAQAVVVHNTIWNEVVLYFYLKFTPTSSTSRATLSQCSSSLEQCYFGGGVIMDLFSESGTVLESMHQNQWTWIKFLLMGPCGLHLRPKPCSKSCK